MPRYDLYGNEHVERYEATGGEEGHEWRPDVYTLILSTRGRKSGEERKTPLIYIRDDDRYVVIASKGGAPEHPAWYLNLEDEREVGVQVADETFRARARDATGEERERLWREMAEIWPDYDEYAKKTDRDIPVVVLEPV
jgi:deazaflavin-dependent oxidoreductase (nitroreductase family)